MGKHSVPQPDLTRPPAMSLGEHRARIRAILAGHAVPPLPGAPPIEVLVPDEAEADLFHAAEKADFTEGGQWT